MRFFKNQLKLLSNVTLKTLKKKSLLILVIL